MRDKSDFKKKKKKKKNMKKHSAGFMASIFDRHPELFELKYLYKETDTTFLLNDAAFF
jgi:hypothetical protein